MRSPASSDSLLCRKGWYVRDTGSRVAPGNCISPADTRLFHLMVGYEDLVEPEQLEWYQKSPEERFLESQRLMAHYLGMGGSLAPDLDPESPFWSAEDLEGFAREMEEAQKRAGVVVRERN